jgi:hypothetical protein
MVSNAELAAVAAELDGHWWKAATTLELIELSQVAPRAMAGLGGPLNEQAARVRRRIGLRVRLGFAHEDCIGERVLDRSFLVRRDSGQIENQHCDCLTQTLDGLPDDEAADKSDVRKAARQLHKRLRPPRKRKPKPTPGMPAEAAQFAPAASKAPEATPAPELVTETATRRDVRPRYRAVKRTPKWFDPPSESIISKIF